jgi:hypothetical protein
MRDIYERLKSTRADMLGTDDERHYWDCHEAADEIMRLRDALDEVVLAWDSRCCEPVDEWLAGEMRPAIDEARAILANKQKAPDDEV